MAASRARWLVTASRTGRGGKAEPALLKWRTLATPGVSDLSNGTSSVIGLILRWTPQDRPVVDGSKPALIRRQYPNKSQRGGPSLWRFYREMRVGDLVIIGDGQRRRLLMPLCPRSLSQAVTQMTAPRRRSRAPCLERDRRQRGVTRSWAIPRADRRPRCPCPRERRAPGARGLLMPPSRCAAGRPGCRATRPTGYAVSGRPRTPGQPIH